MNALKIFINEKFHETFNTIFMKILKFIKKKFNFCHKKFLKIFPNPISINQLLTFP